MVLTLALGLWLVHHVGYGWGQTWIVLALVLWVLANALGGIGGSVHGGLLALLVDAAMLEAMFPMFEPADQPAGTADLNITYMRPALGQTVFAEATVLRKGKTLAVTEVEILDSQRRLCAKGRTIYVIRQKGS